MSLANTLMYLSNNWGSLLEVRATQRLIKESTSSSAMEDVLPFTSMPEGEVLQYRLWRMVDDMRDLTMHGYSGGEQRAVDPSWEAIPWTTYDALVLRYEGLPVRDAIDIKTWFLRTAFPRALQLYFAQKLPTHTAFLESLAWMVEDCDDGCDSPNGECRGKCECDDIPWNEWGLTLLPAIEGYLRLQLACERVDDVLYRGYGVESACSHFGDWFSNTLLPDATKLWVQTVL